jgi:predicted nucleic acid-binding protein
MPKETSPQRNRDRPAKKFIVGDTSVLVSLQTGDLLKGTLSIVQLFVPHDVEDELKLHARLDTNAAAVFSLIRNRKITVCDVQDRRRVNELVALFPKIDIGEAAALVLAEEQNIEVVITDDFKAFPYLKRVTTAKVHISAYLIAGLVVRNRISLDKARAAFDRIARKRNWLDAEIYQHAKRYLDVLTD